MAAINTLPVQFERNYANAPFVGMIFATTAALNAWLTNPTRYAGQTCSLVEAGVVTQFVLNAAKTAWNSAGGGGAGGVSVWVTASVYALDDQIYNPLTNKIYFCNNAHTAAVAFNTDIVNWTELSGGGFVTWVTGTAYLADDQVVDPNTDRMYICNTGHTASAIFGTDLANWDEVASGGFPNWATLKPYYVGDKLYESTNNKLYICNTQHLSFTFAGDIAKWTEITVTESPGVLSLGSTGLHDGAVISIGATTGTFSLTAGNGTHVDSSAYPVVDSHDFVISARTNVALTNILTQPVTYLLVTELDVLIQQAAFPTPEERRDNLFLGVVVHSDNVNVNVVNNEPEVATNVSSQLHDLMQGIGFFNLSGNIITSNGANLSIDKSFGKAFKEGIKFAVNSKDPHTATLAAQVLATFRYRNQDSSEGLDITVLDPTTWDDGGVTTTIPNNNNSTIQRIYMFPSGGIRVQRGQTVFSTLSDAVNAIGKEPFIVEPNISENGLLIASIVLKKSTTDLSDNTDALIFISSRFGELGSVGSSATTTLQEAYENGVDPEITLDAIRGKFTIADNVVPLGNTLFDVTDNGDTEQYIDVSAERVQIKDNDGTHISRKESEVRWIENFKVVAPTTEYTESGGTTTGIIADDIVDELDGYRSAKVTTLAGNQGTKYTSSAKTNLQPVDFQTLGILCDWQYKTGGLNGDWNLVVEESTDGVTYTENARLSLPKEEKSQPATLVFKLNSVAIITHYRHYFEQVGETVNAIARWDNVKVITRPFNYKEAIETLTVEARGNAGEAIGSTTDISFAEVTDTHGAWNGKVLTAPFDGDFICDGAVRTTSSIAATTRFNIAINNINDRVVGSVDTATQTGVFSTVVSLKKGQTLSFRLGQSLTLNNDTNLHNLTITATATQSQVVFKGQATDTEWTDGGALVPNTGSFGTVASNKVLYKRAGQNMDVDINAYQTAAGVAGSGVYLFTLPSGVSFGSDVVTSTTLTVNQSATRIGSGELTTGEGNIIANVSMYAYSSTQYWVHMGATVDDAGGSNSSTLDPWGSANRSLGNTVITLKAKLSFPVDGWSVADPMISFPVTNEVENNFKSILNTVNVPSIQSQGASAIADIIRRSNGVFRIILKSGMFTLPPSITIGALVRSSAGGGGYAMIDKAFVHDETEFTIACYHDTNALNEDAGNQVHIEIGYQGADYKAPQGGFLGNLSQPVAILKYILPNGTQGGDATSGSYLTRPINTIERDGGIVSNLVSNDFLVKAGTYELFAEAAFKDTSYAKLRLYNVDDSSVAVPGINFYSGATMHSTTSGVFTISSDKTMRLQYRVNTSRSPDGLGAATSWGEDEVYTMLQLRKLK